MTITELAAAPDLDELVARKGDRSIGVCIPARNEEATIGAIAGTVEGLRALGLVDDIVVVDDGATDATAERAILEGARVVTSTTGPGKGQALRTAVNACASELLVFLDADVTNFSARYVIELIEPLLVDPVLHLVKASYRRPLDGLIDEGGRVTELLARPLLRRFFPDLAAIGQPLAGECAIRRTALHGLTLADGYGIEIGLLIDIYRRFGIHSIAEADLGERAHRNWPLHELRPHADDVLAAAINRIGQPAWNRSDNP